MKAYSTATKKSLLMLVCAILMIAVLSFASCSVDYAKIRISLKGLDASNLPDGDYPGVARIFPVDVKVLVHVSGGKMTSIDLVKHFNGRGKAAEVLPAAIVAAQTTAIDVVAGATHSSLTILQAVENALTPGN